MLPRLSRFLSAAVIGALLLAACALPRTSATRDPLATLTYDGDQQSLVDLDRAIATAGQDHAKLAPLADRLLNVLSTQAATPAGRQAAAQRLSLFSAELLTKPEAQSLWLDLLRGPQGVALFRLALDRVPGPRIDDLYLLALAQAPNAQRIGLVQSLGLRRVAAAVTKLAPLLDDSDPALANATAWALGEIGTPAALDALKHARSPNSPAILAARFAACHHLVDSAGIAELQAIIDTPDVPAALRSAALVALFYAEPAAASGRLVDILASPDRPAKTAALETVVTLTAADTVSVLTAHLPSFDPDTQASVVAGLGQRGDPTAVPTILALTSHGNAALRAAALTALSRLPGTPEIANRLAAIAAGTDTVDAKLARQALARLDGPQVAAAITAGATTAERPLRIVFLDTLAARNSTESLPLLLQTRADPDAAIRTAALGALADLATPSEQTDLLDWTLAATDPAEQARALRALAAVTSRVPDAATRAQPVIAAIDHASDAVALRLLPVLPRIGDAPSAACVARLALREHRPLASAATTALARWTDTTALEPLVHLAEAAPQPNTRTIAVDGAIRYLQRTRDLPTADFRALVLRLLACATDEAARRKLVYLLGRADDEASLAALTPFKAEPALVADLADAEQSIRVNLAGRPTVRTSANSGQLPALIDSDPNSTWNVPALATQWIEFTFSASRPFRQIVVDGGRNQFNFPEHLDVYVTDDLAQPGSPLASAGGHVGRNVIDLPATAHGRYLIIRHSQTREDAWWTVAEITWD